MEVSSSWMNLFRSSVSHKALSSAVFSALLFIIFCYHFVFIVPPVLLLLFFDLVGYDLLFVYKKKNVLCNLFHLYKHVDIYYHCTYVLIFYMCIYTQIKMKIYQMCASLVWTPVCNVLLVCCHSDITKFTSASA